LVIYAKKHNYPYHCESSLSKRSNILEMKSFVACVFAISLCICFFQAAFADNQPPIGFFDYAGCDTFSGWTCDADNYSMPLEMHFYADAPAGQGTFIGYTSANNTREQAVADLCGGYASHGFTFISSALFTDGLPHIVYAYAINVPAGVNRLFSVKTINCSCAPGEMSGCKECKSDGSQWWDADVRCPLEQRCVSGTCVPCVPETCASLGYSCGAVSDGCGHVLECGTCPEGQICSPNVCDSLPDLRIYSVPAVTDEKILPNSSISDACRSAVISMTAARGEYEPASIVIRSDKDINSLTLEPTSLAGAGGSIPVENVNIRAVKVWWQAGESLWDISHKQLTSELLLKDDSLVRVAGSDNYLRLSNGREILISDPTGILGVLDRPGIEEFPVYDNVSLQPVNLPKNYSKQFWITIRIPDNASPGQYSGKIYLKYATQTLEDLSLNVTILPFNLSSPLLEYSIYYESILAGSGTISPVYRNAGQYGSEQENMLAHGVVNPTVYNSLTDALAIRNRTGISNDVVYFHGYVLAWKNISNIDTIKADIRQLKTSAEAAGVRDFYIYGFDEKDIDSEKRQLIDAAHSEGVKVYDALSVGQANASADVLDLVIAAGAPDSALASKYHSFGHKIFSYADPFAGEERPQTYRRNYGLLLWQNDYDGAMDWAYMGTLPKNVWNDFDYVMRDYNFVYPTADGVIDTVQWEGFREGVDDVKYLSTLLDRVAYAKSIGLNVSSVEEWVADLKSVNLSQADLDDVRGDMIELILSLPEPVCSPGEESGCSVCDANRSAWTDDDSRCSLGEKCVNSTCVSSTTTTTTSTTSTSTTTTTSTTILECAMSGNDPPCGVVELSEVVDAINQWAIGTFELGDVIDLINSWADPVSHSPV
jgi:hypothetical protein